MKKLSLLLATLMLLSISLANASDDTTMTSTTTTNSVESEDSSSDDSGMVNETEHMDSATGASSGHKMGEKMGERKVEMDALKEQKKQEIEMNKEKMKANNEAFKEDRKSMEKPVLTEEQKVELKSIMDTQKVQADEIKKMVEDGTLSKEDAKVKLEALRNATYESLKTLLGNDEIAQKLLGMKKETMDKNMEIRKENVEIRKDFRQQREDLRVKYREQFTKAVGSRLDKMDETKLNTILTRIEAAIAKVEANEKLSQINKDKMLAQLTALKDLINEKLGNTSTEETIDVEALLQ